MTNMTIYFTKLQNKQLSVLFDLQLLAATMMTLTVWCLVYFK